MSNLQTTPARLSRFMLGTVQLGLPYGVANQTGQPNYDLALRMIARAIEGGVNCFDTAAAYGTSEEVLGRALLELNVADQVTVVTKVLPCGKIPTNEARALIHKSIDQSRRLLRLECLPIVLFHREIDAIHLPILKEFQDQKSVGQLGVSCDNFPGPAIQFAKDEQISALQIPANIVDRRHQDSGLFHECQSQKVILFIRSAYLQGLLTMPENQIPEALSPIVPVRHALSDVAANAGISLSELALRSILSKPEVTSVVVGAETIEQIDQNLKMFERGPLDGELLKQIDALSFALPEKIITPSQWPQVRTT